MHEPSVKETAFSCPHCGAYTTQYWHSAYVKYLNKDTKVPFIPDHNFEDRLRAAKELDEETKRKHIEWLKKLRAKILFTGDEPDYERLPVLNNLFLSQCYNCKKWSVWVNEDLLYPPKKFGLLPNQDMSAEVLAVVEEGRSILDLSPKGAAALLRLAIQLICKDLGESGTDLNKDIANLVTRGLSPVVQKSLDVVRVIGNESVHPGIIDLNDDKETAIRLFDLINIIAEQLITQPKHVDALYEKLPETKRVAIEKRDTKNSPKKDGA